MACNGLQNLGNPGQCLTGYYDGLILFKESKTVSISSASLKATWSALSDVVPNDNLMYLKFDNAEFSENETITEDLLGGRQIVVDEKLGMDKYEIIGDECANNTILKNNKNGVTVYGFYTTSGGAILGKLSSDKASIETIEFYMASTGKKATPETTPKVVLNVQAQEDWTTNSHAVSIDFDFSTVSVVKNMFTVNGTGTVDTSVTFDLYYCGYVSNSDAVPANFSLTNSTGATMTISTASQSGNTYTLLVTTLPAGDYTLAYDNTASTDYMYLSETITVTT